MLNAAALCFIAFLIVTSIDKVFQVLYGIWVIIVHIFVWRPVNLKEKYGDWAVVTGSTDGVGKEYAKELAKNGINIIIIGRSLEKLRRTKIEIKRANPSILVESIRADFSEGKPAIDVIKNHLEDFPVGILVNNVGKLTEYPMSLDEVPEDDLWDMINLNVSATTMMTRMVIGKMKERRKGAIVNISSASSLGPTGLVSVYASTKKFVSFFSDSIRDEYKGHGITVQCLIPFLINTKMTWDCWTAGTKFWPSAETFARSAVKTLGRVNQLGGYWLHDLIIIFIQLWPQWLIAKIGIRNNRDVQKKYLAHKRQQ